MVVPTTHPIFHDSKALKKHGSIFRMGESVIYVDLPRSRPPELSVQHTDEEKPIKLIIKAMPGIQSFIKEKLSVTAGTDANSR